ncbi:MAG TPA: hypothetical protein VFO85_19040, partial [Vicinamibacteria bacterium]|nr:hypothetical protein [Vicinamibacteria bacterium]
DAEGRLGRRERDRDGDGRPDHATTYREGAAVGEEVDQDGDGIWEPVARPPGSASARRRAPAAR